MKNIIYYFLFLSVIMFMGSIFADKMLEIEPCELCLVQRSIWISAFIFILLALFIENRILAYIIMSIFIVSALVAFYHFSVQMEWIESRCSADLRGSSKADFFEALDAVSCKEVTLSILGMPVTLINSIISSITACFWYSYVLKKNLFKSK